MKIYSQTRQLSADTFTPVGLYLKLRDYFQQPALLEASDYHTKENSFSFLCFDPLLKILVKDENTLEFCSNAEVYKTYSLKENGVGEVMQKIFSEIEILNVDNAPPQPPAPSPNFSGFFGYTSYDAVPLFENIKFKNETSFKIPPVYYVFYKILIVINHFKDEMTVISNDMDKARCEKKLEQVENLIQNRTSQSFSFEKLGDEQSGDSEKHYIDIVKKAQQHIKRGDVFQIVLSRSFSHKYNGDEFEVYRALRQINPSPYLFYFDFGNFKLFGSSPEAQLVIKNNKAEIHPIAGTFARIGDDKIDLAKAEQLKSDIKETSEHNMLVDLARNDLSRHCKNVTVEKLKEIQFYSHVIHLVSKVCGDLKKDAFSYEVMMDTFPAGTLSGAPKHRAMQLIDELESSARGYYGGAIGYIGLDGMLNHAIMIRTIFSHLNELHYRAGAGILDGSVPENELNEVNMKLNALRKAIEKAAVIKSER